MKSVRVPGKVMLSGEYAVLVGGTAVLAPVTPHIVVSEASPGEPADETPVVRAALALRIPLAESHSALRVTVQRNSFYATDEDGQQQKLGLGGSAAEAVAVVALRLERAGLSWRLKRKMVRSHAIRAHEIAQRGRGSGADVATCAHESWIRYRRKSDGTEIRLIDKAKRPKVPLALVWSGRSANTRIAVERFEAWRAKGGKRVRSRVEGLEASAGAIASLWSPAKESGLLAAIPDYVSRLDRIAQEAGFDYLTKEVATLIRWAEERGGGAKPTGAGGGDMVLMIGDLPLEELPGPVIHLLD